jgi:hypothetical protein
MPAIQPAQLRGQVARLAELYYQPGEFVRQLHRLLVRYADHTHRHGQSGEPSALVAAYKTPPPVMRQVFVATRSFASQDLPATLDLTAALWAEPYLEFRLLAAQLLGQAPCQPPQPVLQRLQAWVEGTSDEQVLSVLFDAGMSRLRQEASPFLLELAESWLAATDLPAQLAGLRMLIPLVEGTSFQNLPTIYRLLTPYLRFVPPGLRPELVALLTLLAQRSPQETAYHLLQALSAPEHPSTPALIRQVLPEFPSEIQEELRLVLKPGRS